MLPYIAYMDPMGPMGYNTTHIIANIYIYINVYPGLITPPYRSTRSTRSSEVQKPNPPNNVTIHSSINDYYKIPMGKDWKTYGKPSDSYEKR